jgi:hypothetical protein
VCGGAVAARRERLALERSQHQQFAVNVFANANNKHAVSCLRNIMLFTSHEKVFAFLAQFVPRHLD